MTLRLVQGMLLRQLCVYGTSGEKKDRTQRRASTGPSNVTTARDDRHLVRMDVTDRTASSTVLSRCWSTTTCLDLDASTVRRRLLRAGLVARMPLRRLPLPRDHQWLRMQWARERRHWRAEWRDVVFSDDSRCNMSNNDGRIRVLRYTGERNLRACILQRHRGPTPSVMVWGAIGYSMRSRLLLNHWATHFRAAQWLLVLFSRIFNYFKAGRGNQHVLQIIIPGTLKCLILKLNYIISKEVQIL